MKGLGSEVTYTRESGENEVYILAYIFYQLRVNFFLDIVAPVIDWTPRLYRTDHIRGATSLRKCALATSSVR